MKPVVLALTLGVFWGVTLGLLTLGALFTGYLESQLIFFVGMYPLYDISLIGAAAGLIGGFVDAFVVGWIIAFLYNAFSAHIK